MARTHLLSRLFRSTRLAAGHRAACYQSNRGAIQTIIAAVTLPLVVLLIMGTLDVVFLYRIDIAAAHAARVAADIAGTTVNYNHGGWSDQYQLRVQRAPGDVKLLEPKALRYLHENESFKPRQCRRFAESVTDATDMYECVVSAAVSGGMAAKVWPGFNSAVTGNDIYEQTFPMPFSLYEENPANPSHSPVMILPQVQVARACLEPFNETGATVGATPGITATGADSSLCRFTRTLTYYTGEEPDFDGDGRSDAVFFRARGAGTGYSSNVIAPADVDFIAMKSGAAYSAVNGTEFANLTVDPQALPIVADYDRDGRADFAVFEPSTGNYRVKFSSCPGLIGQAAIAAADPTGTLGYVAFPGEFTTRGQMQLAVIQTGGVAESRYNVHLSGNIVPQSSCAGFSNPSFTTLSAARFKPKRGMVAIPTAQDINGDGLKELGYLSYSGGNLTKKIAGAVDGLANPGFNQAIANHPDSGTNIRMNPFDMEVDSSGRLYYVDSVGGTVWRGTVSGGVFTSGPEIFVGGSTTERSDPEEDYHLAFPRENVFNLPEFDAEAEGRGLDACSQELVFDEKYFRPSDMPPSCYEGFQASDLILNNPRQIAIGADHLYIADYGNHRIVRVDISSGEVIVLYASLESTDDTSLDYWPMAVEMVPLEAEGTEALAVSYGYGVMVLYGVNGTLDEVNGMEIHQVAGWFPPSPMSQWAAQRDRSASVHASYELFTPGPVNGAGLYQALASWFCPITSMAYRNNSLFMTSSCSVKVPGAGRDNLHRWSDPGPDEFIAAGGILELHDPENNGLMFTSPNTGIRRIAGSFDPVPCRNGTRCSRPHAGTGAYKRVVDVGGSNAALPPDPYGKLLNLDIINPVDIAVDAEGSIYFINQWNQGPINFTGPGNITSNTLSIAYSPHFMDRHHEAAVYKIVFNNGGNHDIFPIGSPYAFGQHTVPVEGEDWFAPYTHGGAYIKHVEAFEAPARLFDWPAAAGLALSGNHLFTSTPFLAPPASYGCTSNSPHPYCTRPEQIGFIYATELDLDFDGIPDLADNDDDGDGQVDAAADPQRGCAPLTSGVGAGTTCRTQEKNHLPVAYFFSLVNADVITVLTGDFSTPTDADLVEFVLMNSVSEYDQSPAQSTQRKARSDPWALLFWYGNDQFLGEPRGCTSDNDSNIASGYWDCTHTANGPILTAEPLHAFVGLAENSYPATDPLELPAGWDASSNPIHPNHFKFPVILQSTRPRENGIKPVMRRPAYVENSTRNKGAPRGETSGVLCWDYFPVSINNTGDINDPGNIASARVEPFSSGISDSFLQTQLYSGIDPRESYEGIEGFDTDNLNYLAACGNNGSRVYSTGSDSSSTVLTEAVVLQLDHDDTQDKLAGLTQAPHWPFFMFTRTFAEDPDLPENVRQFILLKNDDNETGDPTWLTTETARNIAPAARNLLQSYSMVSGALKTGSQLENEQRRWPMSSSRLGFEPYFLPLGGENPAISPYSNFGKILKGLSGGGYDAVVFDHGKSINGFLESFIVGLDHEPWMRKLPQDPDGDAATWLAASYSSNIPANYAVTNRFRRIDNDYPPAVQAARGLVEYQLPGYEFVPSYQQNNDLVPGQYNVTFLDANRAPCVVYENSLAAPAVNSIAVGYRACHFVKVAVAVEAMGAFKVIQHTVPIQNPTQFDDICDPNHLDGIGWSCTGGEVEG